MGAILTAIELAKLAWTAGTAVVGLAQDIHRTYNDSITGAPQPLDAAHIARIREQMNAALVASRAAAAQRGGRPSSSTRYS